MTTQPQAVELDETERDPHDLEAAEPEASLLPRVAAELAGTFVLVAAIVVVAALGTLGSGATVLYVALAGGLALVGMVVAFGSVSGAHLNPAVSLAAAIAGRLRWADLLPYVVAQTLGAVAAGGLLRVLIPADLPAALGVADVPALVGRAANGFGANSPLYTLSSGAVTISTAQAFIVEAVATAILATVVLAATKRPNPSAPLAIGGALTVTILIAGQLTNAAINPARATGTAFFASDWAMTQLWLFWAAPLVGAAIVGLIALLIDRSQEPVEEWDEEYEDEDDELDEQPRWEPEHTTAITAEEPDPADIELAELQEIEEDGETVTPVEPGTDGEPAGDEPEPKAPRD